jgi:hypothetical protein
MGALEFLEHCMWFTIGFMLGAAVLYFGTLIVEWIDDRKVGD